MRHEICPVTLYPYGLAVECHFGIVVDESAEHALDLAVDYNAPGENMALGLPPRRHAGMSEKPLKPHHRNKNS
jgi:hypothetical protein